MSCLQVLTAHKAERSVLSTQSLTTPVRSKKGVEGRRSTSDREERCSKTTDPQKKSRWMKNSYQTAYCVRNKRRPACLSELLILFAVWEVFPVIRLESLCCFFVLQK